MDETQHRRSRITRALPFAVSAAFLGVFAVSTVMFFRRLVQFSDQIYGKGTLHNVLKIAVPLAVLAAFIIAAVIWSVLHPAADDGTFHRTYFVFGLLLCIMYLVVLPPFSAPDEQQHFNTAWYYSSKVVESFNSTPVADRSGALYNAPLIALQRNLKLRYSPDMWDLVSNLGQYNYSWTDFFVPIFDHVGDSGRQAEVLHDCVGYKYSFVQYLPSSIVLGLCRIFGVGTVLTVFLGRLAQAVAFLLLSALAIKRTPVFKRGFAVVCMLPQSLCIAASYSADTILNAVSVLFFAECLRMSYSDKTVTLKNMLVLAVLSCVLVSVKAVYAPIILLVFLLPPSRFRSRKTWILFLSGLFALCGAIWMISNLGLLSDSVSGALQAKETGYTLSDILHAPVWTLNFLIKSIFEQFGDLTQLMIGRFLGWLNDIPVSEKCIVAFQCLLIISTFPMKSEPTIDGRPVKRIVCLAVASIVVFLVFLAELLHWTPVGASSVTGVHGRYLLPVFALIMYGLQGCLAPVPEHRSASYVHVAAALNIVACYSVFVTIICAPFS